MKCSLIITTYNWPEALELSILSVFEQSKLPDEIIIADDGSTDETKNLVEKLSKKSPIPLIHSWQDDRGFRASRSRNLAIARSKNNYIILIDGDMILHKNFVNDHISNSKDGCFIQGSRVIITKKKSKKVLLSKQLTFCFLEKGLKNRLNAIHNNIFKFFFKTYTKSHEGIKTCNISFFKNDCINVNGFNEEFIGWGREDSEYVERLYNSGIQRKNIKFNCVAYHIWHNENSRNFLCINDDILQKAIDEKSKWCDNGINKYMEV